ncbi:MAG TPA: hypothetical protein VFA85_15600 [Terriglobales bacterium]|nr:hypothetical protein [Terriglobales bacterium]
MTRITRCLVSGVTILCAGLGLAVAQDNSETTPPPKVLLVQREFLKPGKSGSVHEKSESAFVQAFTRAKWPQHYFAVSAVTGKPRVLFLSGYDSFEAWEKDSAAMGNNKALSAALDHAIAGDADLLSDADQTLLTYDDAQSLNSAVDIAHMRYFEISVYRLKPGHRHDWEDLVKLVKSAYEKVPDTHWAVYDAMYGQQGATYLVFVPMKSAKEIDEGFAKDKQFVDAMGEDGMKKLAELEQAAVELTQSNLFQFNPKMSYPRDEWVKADPDFWKPKPAATAMAPMKKEEKPADKK